MYTEYWKMTRKPFENTPDPQLFFASPQHDEGLMRLVYSIQEKKGAALLTGAFGCGKTMLIYTLMQKALQGRYKFALVSNPLLSPKELLEDILHKLGRNITGNSSKSDLHKNLEEVLANNIRNAQNTVVIIDEAHIIDSPTVFEEIRMLLNYHDANQFFLTLLLVGQPELVEKIRRNPALSQRIAVQYVLGPLSSNEVGDYIVHRLKAVNVSPDLFTPESMAVIRERTGGIPRKINHICDMSLFIGYDRKEKKITAAIAREAAKEMGI